MTVLTTLVTFDFGSWLGAGLFADAAGNLYGTTEDGGANGDGSVFEIVKTGNGYASTPTTLVSFNGNDGSDSRAGLVADAAGDLFGTTLSGGTGGDGTVFEIANTGTGYASTPTTLVNFSGTNGSTPYAGLLADAAGDLFGTTLLGGANNAGEVFEIAKTGNGYASTPTILVSFNQADGDSPQASLIADAAGNLFGTTTGGGASNDGTVFEIVKTGTGYASTPTTLASFNFTNGTSPEGTLYMNAAGTLFGTTSDGDGGSSSGYGTVFEIAETNGSYASAPTTLAVFNFNNGDLPVDGLVADTAGNLFGTTFGGGPGSGPGGDGGGTVFELSDLPPTVTTIAPSPSTGVETAGDTITFTLTMTEAVTVTGTPVLSLNDGDIATYQSGSGTKTLLFTTTVGHGNHTATLGITGNNLNGSTISIASAATGAAADFTSTDVMFPGLSVYSPILDLTGQNVTLPDGVVFTTTYLTQAYDVTNSGFVNATLTEGGGPSGNTYTGVISDGAHATTAITQTSGEVTFASASTYTGGTLLEGGTIGLGNASALGTGQVTIENGATLRIGVSATIANAINFAGAGTIDTQGNSVALSGALTGSGQFTKIGTGSLALGGQTYTGNLYVNAGTLQLDGVVTTGQTHMADGTTLILPGQGKFDQNFTISNVVLDGAVTLQSSTAYWGPDGLSNVSGIGSLHIVTPGGVHLFGTNTYTGGTAVDTGTFLAVYGSLAGNMTDNGSVTFSNGGVYATTSFGGQISGSGSVNDYTNILTLGGSSNYSGGTTIGFGSTLVAASSQALGTGAVNVSGGELKSGAASVTLGNVITIQSPGIVDVNTNGWTLTLSSGSSLANNGTLETLGGALIVDDAVTGTGAAQIQGGGTLEFNANFQQAVTFSGAGTLALSQAYNGAISGFGAGDAIDFTSLAYKSSYHAVWVQNGSNGTLAIEDSAAGNSVVDSVALNGSYPTNYFKLADYQGATEVLGPTKTPSDFNGDGTSDILLQNSSGSIIDWMMSNGTYSSYNPFGTAPGYTILGTGDFNGNGTSDILLQDGSGNIIDWLLQSGQYSSYSNIGNPNISGYGVVGTGDFNGDGTSDLLLENGSGGLIDWMMQNGTYSSYNAIGNTSGYGIIGTGDFSGKGTTDVLLQNSSGSIIDWMLQNGQYSSYNNVGNANVSGYGGVGTGDFNGDGTTDLLLENGSGNLIDWIMQNGKYASYNEIGNTSGYSVVGTGDYNGDGTSDILLQNASGNVIDWTMHNGQFSGWNEVGSTGSYAVVNK